MAITGVAGDFLTDVIRPALTAIGLWSQAAEELVLGTAIHESGGFRFRQQLGSGPALGYFQMEPDTHNDIWTNYLAFHKDLAAKVASLLSAPGADKLAELRNNDQYGAAMARLRYARVSEPLPAQGQLADQAQYWKRYYNTPLGGGTVDQYIRDWNSMVNSN